MSDPGARGAGVGILGLGVALPPGVRTNSFWDGLLGPRDEEQRRGDVLAVERTFAGAPTAMPAEVADAIAATGDDLFRGAKTRHVLADDALVSDLEADAARAALADARAGPDEIDLLLVHSLVPDVLIPSNGPALQHKLGLDRAAAWSLDVGCASFQAQLVTAAALIRSGTFARALIVQSHAGTRSVDVRSAASPNFGDAAVAAVVGRTPQGFGLLGQWQRTDGSLRDGIVLAPVVEGRAERAWWRTAAAPRLTSFDPDAGKRAGLRAGEFCREACAGALLDARLAMEDVDLYVGNQSLGWFVDACRRALGLPKERVIETFADVANIGDAAIVHNLVAARARGRLGHGDVVLAYSPAAGFTRSAVVMRWFEARQSPR